MVWLVRVAEGTRLAQTVTPDEVHEGQVVVIPIWWAISVTSRLHDLMKEITLGIRDDISDVPLGQQAGAVVAAARRTSAILA
eukprot:7695323-Alexandrium_andersonii.AAC.1